MHLIKTVVVAALIAVSAGKTSAGFAYPARTMESSMLGRTIEYSLIVPMQYLSDPNSSFPVLFALHGHGAQYTAYTSMQQVKNAVETDPMLVVAFNAGDNYYLDVTDFFFDEFVPFIDSAYRTNGEYAATGFSMGGFGSFHFMMTDTDFFSSVSAKSAAFYARSRDLNTKLVAAAGAGTELPPLYMDCGTADSWISNQREMRDTLTALGYAHEYKETAAAGHDWTFWSAAMTPIVAFHGSHFEYPSTIDDRAVTGGAVQTMVSPNPSNGIFTVIGFKNGTVNMMTTDGVMVGSVPVYNGTVNWKSALPGLAGGVYVISSTDGAVQARVMLVR